MLVGAYVDVAHQPCMLHLSVVHPYVGGGERSGNHQPVGGGVGKGVGDVAYVLQLSVLVSLLKLSFQCSFQSYHTNPRFQYIQNI